MFLIFCIIIMGIQYGIAQNLDENCVTFYKNISGVCTLASKCPSARREYQKNGIFPTICKHSGKKLLVCCINDSSRLTTPVVYPKPLNPKRVSERKCEEYNQILYQNGGDKCRNTDVDLLVGSESANQGEFAHMAAVGWLINESYQFLCRGSLISSRFVLTCGRCMSVPGTDTVIPSIVRLGYQILDPKIRDANPIDVPIKTVHQHPQFIPYKGYSDIGLIELNVNVNFNADIRPACLWNKPDFPGYTKAITVVWENSYTVEKEHYKVLLSLVENDYCNVLLENMHNKYWYGLTESQMCAGQLCDGKHRCQEPPGTPLQVTSRDNKCAYQIIALKSLSFQFETSYKPVVFTRVSSYLDWIESVVWPDEQ